MWHPFQAIPEGWPRGLTFVALLIATWLIGAKTNVELRPDRMNRLELAGTSSRAASVIKGWTDSDTLANAVVLQRWDDWFLIVYPLVFALACIIVADLWAGPAYALGVALAWASLAMMVLDFLENRSINRMLAGNVEAPWPQLAFTCAAPKFAILFLATLYVAAGLIARLSTAGPPTLGP